MRALFKFHKTIQGTTRLGLTSLLIIFNVSCSSSYEEDMKAKVHTDNRKISMIEGTWQISGIYPHLTTYSHARLDGQYGFGNECGIGALAIWNNKLYLVNYAAHQPKGSEHNLYIIDEHLRMEIFPESVEEHRLAE